MHGFKKVGLALLIGALVAGCGDKKDEVSAEGAPAQVAARVNGTAVTVGQVNHALQRIANLDPEQSKAAPLQMARTLVDQEVIAQKAVADKLDRDPAVAEALEAARRKVLADAYMSRKLGDPVAPTDTEITEYFDKHPELFAQRKIYRLQELSIQAPQDKHEAIQAKLKASKSMNDFAAWLKAENYPVKAAQGIKAAEQLPLDMLPKLAQVPAGQAMVVNVPEGLLVIIVAGAQSQPVTLEQAKPAIARALQAQARQKAAKAELDALKAAAKIEYVGEFADAGKQESAAPADAAAPSPEAPAQK